MIIVTPSFGKMFSGFEECFQKSCFVMVSVNSRPDRRNKAAFSNLYGIV